MLSNIIVEDLAEKCLDSPVAMVEAIQNTVFADSAENVGQNPTGTFAASLAEVFAADLCRNFEVAAVPLGESADH